MNEDVPSRFARGYVHKAVLVCPSCEGDGFVHEFVCGPCNGRGGYEVGCGGAGEVDALHAALGGNCIAEDRLFPLEEFTLL